MDITHIINKIGLPLGIIYSLLIVGFVIYFWRLYKVYFTKQWPSVPGIVNNIELVKNKRRTSSGAPINIFDLKLKYEYSVNGKSFTGDKLRYFHARGNYKKHLEAYLIQFAKGTKVTVYHNPKKPSQSLLIPGITKGAWVPFFFFILALGSITPVLISKLN